MFIVTCKKNLNKNTSENGRYPKHRNNICWLGNRNKKQINKNNFPY